VIPWTGSAKIPGMGDDELTDFLEVYVEVCAGAGIDPLARA
jgi:hypothetical protein